MDLFLNLRLLTIEIGIHFSDDIGEEQFWLQFKNNLFTFSELVKNLFNRTQHSYGNLIYPILAIYGPTNSGKSSLFNLLLGESILNLKDQKYLAEVEGRSHKLTPKKQKQLYSIFFLINPKNFKLQKQMLEVDETKQILRINYDNYVSLENQLIPRKIVLNSYRGEDYTFIDISFRSLTINKEISTPYNIPEGYKRIKL